MAVIVSKPNLAALNAFAMTKSELIERITTRQAQLSAKDVELAVKTMIEHMAQTLAQGHRIEIRGFGSFSLHYRAPRIGRNPKTGESVGLSGKYVPHFKPGKELRDRVNESLIEFPTPAVQNTRKPTRDLRSPRVDGDD